jgi:hypothetical protein
VILTFAFFLQFINLLWFWFLVFLAFVALSFTILSSNLSPISYFPDKISFIGNHWIRSVVWQHLNVFVLLSNFTNCIKRNMNFCTVGTSNRNICTKQKSFIGIFVANFASNSESCLLKIIAMPSSAASDHVLFGGQAMNGSQTALALSTLLKAILCWGQNMTYAMQSNIDYPGGNTSSRRQSRCRVFKSSYQISYVSWSHSKGWAHT